MTLPGESYPSSALVDACSTLLLAPNQLRSNDITATERKFLRRSSGLLGERTSLSVQTRDTGIQDEIGRLVIGRDHAQRFHRTGSYLYCAFACNGKPRGRS